MKQLSAIADQIFLVKVAGIERGFPTLAEETTTGSYKNVNVSRTGAATFLRV